MTVDQLEQRYDREYSRLERDLDRGRITLEIYDQKLRQLATWYAREYQHSIHD
jgi:hypothetical protein